MGYAKDITAEMLAFTVALQPAALASALPPKASALPPKASALPPKALALPPKASALYLVA